MRGRAAWAALVVVVVAMLAPVPIERDSYPLSDYPMFASDRGRISRVATVVGRTGDGAVERLSPQLIGGTDEVVLAVETVAKAVRAGAERSADLCRRVAARVAPARPGVSSIEVRVEVHDAVAYFTDDRRDPLETHVHATCEVPR